MNITKNNLKDFVKVLLEVQEDLKNSNITLSKNLLDKIINSFLSVLGETSTNKSIFKFSNSNNDESLYKDPIIWFISEEMIQSDAEMEIDRRLTDVELHRVYECFFEDDDTMDNRTVLIRQAIRNAVDQPEQWSDLDKDFLETKNAEKEVSTNDKSKKVCN